MYLRFVSTIFFQITTNKKKCIHIYYFELRETKMLPYEIRNSLVQCTCKRAFYHTDKLNERLYEQAYSTDTNARNIMILPSKLLSL